MVNTNPVGAQSQGSVAAVDDGGYVVVWRTEDTTAGDSDTSGISGQRFDGAGNPVGGEFAAVDFLLVFRSVSEGRGMPSWPLEAIPGGVVPSTRVAQPLGIRGGEWRVGAELQIPPDGLDYSIGTRVESMPLCCGAPR